MSDDQPTIGDLRVWWIPQVPGEMFTWPVGSIAEGRNLEDLLASYDEFQLQQRVKPDYFNDGGVQRYEEDGQDGYEWCDVDDDEEDDR